MLGRLQPRTASDGFLGRRINETHSPAHVREEKQDLMMPGLHCTRDVHHQKKCHVTRKFGAACKIGKYNYSYRLECIYDNYYTATIYAGRSICPSMNQKVCRQWYS